MVDLKVSVASWCVLVARQNAKRSVHNCAMVNININISYQASKCAVLHEVVLHRKPQHYSPTQPLTSLSVEQASQKLSESVSIRQNKRGAIRHRPC